MRERSHAEQKSDQKQDESHLTVKIAPADHFHQRVVPFCTDFESHQITSQIRGEIPDLSIALIGIESHCFPDNRFQISIHMSAEPVFERFRLTGDDF